MNTQSVGRAPGTPEAYKARILVAVSLLGVVALCFVGPIPQDPAYHHFADMRRIYRIDNFWNVASNLPFLLAGVWGLWRYPRLKAPECRSGYFVLCAGTILVGFGSACYHLAPSNATLLWDRLPMTVAFMALLSLLLGERISGAPRPPVLSVLVIVGVCAALYWSWTEAQGRGDLRPYALVQFLPMVLIPLILLMYPQRYIPHPVAGRRIRAVRARQGLRVLRPRDLCGDGVHGRARAEAPRRSGRGGVHHCRSQRARWHAQRHGQDLKSVPRYEVTVQGRGILLRLQSEVAVGFLRVVHVRARGPLEAQRQAMRIVREQWEASGHAAANQGAAPYLAIDTIGLVSFWQRLLGFPRGYIFFSADGVQARSDPPGRRR